MTAIDTISDAMTTHDAVYASNDQTGQGESASEVVERTEPEILVPEESPKARPAQKEYYKILRKQNVGYNQAKKRYELRYYANDNPQSARQLPLYEIATDHSEDDNKLKYPFAAFCYALLAMAAVSLFHVIARAQVADACQIPSGWYPTWCDSTIALVMMGVVLGLAFLRLAWVIDNNFVHIDADWRNAIDKFFAPDVYSKMMGVRLCMLKFRQFIKWRRFANFFLRLFAVSFLAVLGCAAVWRVSMGIPEVSEVVLCLCYLLGLGLTISWFQAQRLKHTEWRDPTVQLSVMIAELHQKHVDNRVQVGGGTRT